MSNQTELELEVKEHRESQREVRVFKVLRYSLSVLSERGFRYLALLISAALFSWAMWEPEALRIVVAGIFAGMVFLPVLFKKGGGDGE